VSRPVRVLLFTGKGGVGKTTSAAGAALLAAASGRKTLVVSTDPAHSLADALGVPVGAHPTPVPGADGLEALQVDTQAAFVRSWEQVSRFLTGLVAATGVDPLGAEEMTVLPGAEEVLALLALREQVEEGRHDLVVVDCAPTSETLRLLALPDVLTWYLDRLFPLERRIGRLLRLGRRARDADADGTGSDAALVAAAEQLHEQLSGVRSLLADPERTAVRLVLTPEQVGLAEARRTLTSLALYGYRVDAVLANRIIPRGGNDGWRDGWAAAQEQQLAAVRADVAPLPVLVAPYAAAEPVGVAALLALAEGVYGELDPVEGVAELAAGAGEPMTVRAVADGFDLRLRLPFADRAAVDLARRGDDLIVSVAARRRVVALPSALRRCTVAGARWDSDVLAVRFEPDPAVWMQR
jgi:arsenite-transporting ATPase